MSVKASLFDADCQRPKWLALYGESFVKLWTAISWRLLVLINDCKTKRLVFPNFLLIFYGSCVLKLFNYDYLNLEESKALAGFQTVNQVPVQKHINDEIKN